MQASFQFHIKPNNAKKFIEREESKKLIIYFHQDPYESKTPMSVSGRITDVRRLSKNLTFIDIQSGGKELSSLQLKCGASLSNNTDVNHLRRGDVIGASGSTVLKTSSGELSLLPTEIKILSPCLRTIPSSKTGLDNINKRFRNRHVDFHVRGQEKRRIFEIRSKTMCLLRKYLDERDFLEVETPVLSTEYGGACAEPFITHHEDLGLDMYLRVSPELFLKRLVIGGFDRVYEIGRQFRNEGADSNHSPEFTSVEFYAAYADYNDLAEWTHELLRYIVLSIFDSYDFNYCGDTLRFSEDFSRFKYIELLESATGKSFPAEFETEEKEKNYFLNDILLCHGLLSKHSDSNAKLLDKIFSSLVEPELVQPTIVVDHPRCMSPLAKPHRENPSLSERFELFAGRQELINAYTEMNDPQLQRKAFSDYDNREEFCKALEYGLPPTAGWGLGFDRLIMLLTNQTSIKEVILFPTLKPNS